jgi:hypothetical protein
MVRAKFLGNAVPIIETSLEDICGLVTLTKLSIRGKKNKRREKAWRREKTNKRFYVSKSEDAKLPQTTARTWFMPLQRFGMSSELLHSMWCLPSSYKV